MVNYRLYRTGQLLALSLPLKIVYKFAVLISDLHYLFAARDKKEVSENLKAIFPQKNEREIGKIRKEVFRNFAKYLADFFRFEKIDADYIKKYIRVENRHFFDEALAAGSGAIALTAHIGNWELGGAVISLLGYSFYAVALPHKDKKVDDFFNFQRERKGVKVIPLGRAVRASLDVLKQNKVLALVGDRVFNEKGVVIDFFGKPTAFPQGPAALALKTGAKIIPGFLVRNPDDTFTLRMEKPLEFTAGEDKEKVIKEVVVSYKILLEGYVRKYPDQWYMFRRYWIE
ncbi:MAG: lysophospholipid acyltransferase family protein [Candidatus Omnitrophica bacterium]|nr:lysophospholipid acyltransferase family protein [Candidatus Omnitrophota bacterium]